MQLKDAVLRPAFQQRVQALAAALSQLDALTWSTRPAPFPETGVFQLQLVRADGVELSCYHRDLSHQWGALFLMYWVSVTGLEQWPRPYEDQTDPLSYAGQILAEVLPAATQGTVERAAFQRRNAFYEHFRHATGLALEAGVRRRRVSGLSDDDLRAILRARGLPEEPTTSREEEPAW